MVAKLIFYTRKFAAEILHIPPGKYLILMLGLVLPVTGPHAEQSSEVELINFAFGNYLGSGFYSSSNIDVFIVKLPFLKTLKAPTETEAGLIINYPVSLGITNISDDAVEGIPDFNDIGTVSVVPGLEYVHCTVPSPRGEIISEWTREGTGIRVRLTVPKGVAVDSKLELNEQTLDGQRQEYTGMVVDPTLEDLA